MYWLCVGDGGCCSLAVVVGECDSLVEVGVGWHRGVVVFDLVAGLVALIDGGCPRYTAILPVLCAPY
jgi:hypothetical protein